MKQICQETFEKGVFTDSVRDTTFITKSNSARQSIFEYDRRHNCAKDYFDVAQELVTNVENRNNSELSHDRKRSTMIQSSSSSMGFK